MSIFKKSIDKETEKTIRDLAKENEKLKYELEELQGKYDLALNEIIKLQQKRVKKGQK